MKIRNSIKKYTSKIMCTLKEPLNIHTDQDNFKTSNKVLVPFSSN